MELKRRADDSCAPLKKLRSINEHTLLERMHDANLPSTSASHQVDWLVLCLRILSSSNIDEVENRSPWSEQLTQWTSNPFHMHPVKDCSALVEP